MIQAAIDKKKALAKAKEFSALLEKIAALERIDPVKAGRLETAVGNMPEGAQARSEYMAKLKEMLESGREGSKDTREDLGEKIEALRADLEEIERRIRDLERRLLESGSEREAIIAEINATLARRVELEKQLAELARQRGEMERQLDAAREKKQELSLELEEALARAQKLSSLSGGDSRKKEQKAAGRMPGPQLQITILPNQMVMAVGGSVALKAVAVFDNLFIKEISADSEWFTDDPSVAVVDSQGNVRGCGRGVTTVGLRYKNAVVKKIDVAVGEPGSGHMKELGEITR